MYLNDFANEKSTFIVEINFKDESGEPKNLISLSYSLYNEQGNIINSKENVSVSLSNNSINHIVLTGDDLVIEDSESIREERTLKVTGTYNSDLSSSPLEVKEDFIFYVQNLKG